MNPIFLDLINHDDTPATILNSIIVKEFGAGCYNWEPESLWLELQNELTEPLGDFTKDKISAVIALNTSEQFYTTWECFENIGSAFNDNLVLFEHLTPLSTEELTWTILEAKLNDNSFSTFSDDIEAYIQTVFRKSGVTNCPKFIQKYCKYKRYNNYNKKIEAINQKRIELYCAERVRKIIRLSKEYLGQSIKDYVVIELPEVKDFLD